MKIKSATAVNRRKEFEIQTRSGAIYSYPYAKCDPHPGTENQVAQVVVDRELASEAISFTLESGDEGSVHIEQILDYNGDPKYLAEMLIYKLTLEAQRGMEASGLSRRQIAKRLNTSVPQLYRLLDPTNTRKSMTQLVALLHILDCEVDVVVKQGTAA